jgi:hypothetical protein
MGTNNWSEHFQKYHQFLVGIYVYKYLIKGESYDKIDIVTDDVTNASLKDLDKITKIHSNPINHLSADHLQLYLRVRV